MVSDRVVKLAQRAPAADVIQRWLRTYGPARITTGRRVFFGVAYQLFGGKRWSLVLLTKIDGIENIEGVKRKAPEVGRK